MANIHTSRFSNPPFMAELASADWRTHVQQIQKLEKLWHGANPDCHEEKAAEARAELGKLLGTDELSRWYGGRLMYTLASHGEQFRCWYAPFGSVAHGHIDSCGEGLLYGITGSANDVSQYATALTSGNLEGYLRSRDGMLATIWVGW